MDIRDFLTLLGSGQQRDGDKPKNGPKHCLFDGRPGWRDDEYLTAWVWMRWLLWMFFYYFYICTFVAFLCFILLGGESDTVRKIVLIGRRLAKEKPGCKFANVRALICNGQNFATNLLGNNSCFFFMFIRTR